MTTTLPRPERAAAAPPDGVRRAYRDLDGQLAGCGAVRTYEPFHADLPRLPGVGEVKRMYTRPAARRRGVSRALLVRLEAIAVDLGFHRLLLETGSPQPEALALYESAGWTPIDPYGHYREEPTSRCYAKDLAG